MITLRNAILFTVGTAAGMCLSAAIEPVVEKVHIEVRNYEVNSNLATIGRFLITSLIVTGLVSAVVNEVDDILDIVHFPE